MEKHQSYLEVSQEINHVEERITLEIEPCTPSTIQVLGNPPFWGHSHVSELLAQILPNFGCFQNVLVYVIVWYSTQESASMR